MKHCMPAVLLLAALSAFAAKPDYVLRTSVVRNGGGVFVVGVDVRSADDRSLFTQSVEMKSREQQIKTPYGNIRIVMNADGSGYAMAPDDISVFELEPPAGYVRVQTRAGLQEPRVLRHVNPHYPEKARTVNASGLALIDTRLSADGTVEAVRILRDPGYGLGDAAAEAVRQWRFAPAMKDGQPVASLFAVKVSFKVH